MNAFINLSATALPFFTQELQKDSDGHDASETSKTCSDVSEDCTPSTTRSDDVPAVSDSDSPDEEIVWQGLGQACMRVPPWRRDRGPKSLETSPKMPDDCDAEAISSGAETCAEKDTSASDSPPLSSRSESAEVLSISSEPEALQAPGPFLASIVRWDAAAGAWVPDEIEITPAARLPPFAMAFSNGAEACIEKDAVNLGSCKPDGRCHGKVSSSEMLLEQSAAVLSLIRPKRSAESTWDAVTPQQDAQAYPDEAYEEYEEAWRSDDWEYEEYDKGWDKKWSSSWNRSWQDWPAEAETAKPLHPLRGDAAPFTPVISLAATTQRSSFSASAPSFVPGASGDAATSQQRTRLSARATLFVPQVGA